MGSTPEGRVKSRIKAWLSAQGFYHFSPIGGPYAVHGVPDIVVCANGRFVGIECKAPGKEKNTTKNQDLHKERIERNQGVAIVTSKLEDVVEIFTKLGLV